ncbi:MAG TPA: ATP-dependent helicase [Solirubrobacterales bacterium]|nr:ATP-dependent helicase [Solirubrobacterales bacterium]
MASNSPPEAAPFYTGPVRWHTGADNGELDGFVVVPWQELLDGWIAEARGVGMNRGKLDSAAQGWLDWLSEVDRLAVVGVEVGSAADAAALLGFVVEPATRRGVELVIVADCELGELDDDEFFEPAFGHAYSLERLRWRLRGVHPARQAPAELEDSGFSPDPTQAAAVTASEGVVQIIAPAGSGKTTVLVERVRELRRRGVPAKAITCLTFNRAAKKEMADRLEKNGVGNVEAYTFHGLGRRILVGAGALRPDMDIKGPSLGQWRRLAAIARRKAEDGVWIDPGEAAEKLSQIKLGLLMTPPQYAELAAAAGDPEQLTMAALYETYEEGQREQDQIDFDDLVLRAVLLLREDEQVRGQWQTRFEHLLVDEYQDIEPAQELIVRIIGAPHDQLFCVGDEDQTLYAFRRASVERIISLDGIYPGLERVALGVNYRCGKEIVAASRTLIDRNQIRFRKTIEPKPGAETGEIRQFAYERQGEDAGETAKLLKTKRRGEIAVLARTTNTLRPLALACADLGVGIDGGAKLFEPTGARLALELHLRLALHPEQATAELIQRVCRTPSRGLNSAAARTIAESLRQGMDFEHVFEDVPAPRRGRGALLAPGDLFTAVRDCESAAEAVFVLRGEGGLDAWFEESDDLGGLDQFEIEVLERAEQEAAGRTPREFLADLEHQTEKLRAIRDEDHGIEFLTIHGAKGRQWPHVILVGCEEGTMPHAKALKVEPRQEALGEGIEGERRLAYVAFTRAQERLDLHFDRKRPSPFLREAGVQTSREARTPPPVPKPPGLARGAKSGLGRLLRRRG